MEASRKSNLLEAEPTPTGDIVILDEDAKQKIARSVRNPVDRGEYEREGKKFYLSHFLRCASKGKKDGVEMEAQQ